MYGQVVRPDKELQEIMDQFVCVRVTKISNLKFETFAPRKVAEGEQWNVPDSVAKKLCRVASPMCYQHAPQPSWVKDVVIKARNGLAELSYEGKMSSERVWPNGKVLSEQ